MKDWNSDEKGVSSSFNTYYKETFLPLYPSESCHKAHMKECSVAILWNIEGIFNIYHS